MFTFYVFTYLLVINHNSTATYLSRGLGVNEMFTSKRWGTNRWTNRYNDCNTHISFLLPRKLSLKQGKQLSLVNTLVNPFVDLCYYREVLSFFIFPHKLHWGISKISNFCSTANKLALGMQITLPCQGYKCWLFATYVVNIFCS